MHAKCAMCGNEAIISDEHDLDKNEQQREVKTSDIIIEQIDGTCYTFDSADCAIMFKRFSDVYCNNFAD